MYILQVSDLFSIQFSKNQLVFVLSSNNLAEASKSKVQLAKTFMKLMNSFLLMFQNWSQVCINQSRRPRAFRARPLMRVRISAN